MKLAQLLAKLDKETANKVIHVVAENRLSGVVDLWDKINGFGEIKSSGKTYFVKWDYLTGESFKGKFKDLTKGQKVTFIPKLIKNTPQATDVSVVMELDIRNKEATFSKKFKELTYWTSHNTSKSVQCDNVNKAKLIIEKSGIPQTLKITAFRDFDVDTADIKSGFQESLKQAHQRDLLRQDIEKLVKSKHPSALKFKKAFEQLENRASPENLYMDGEAKEMVEKRQKQIEQEMGQLKKEVERVKILNKIKANDKTLPESYLENLINEVRDFCTDSKFKNMIRQMKAEILKKADMTDDVKEFIRRDYDGVTQVDYLVEKMIGEYLIKEKINW